MSSTIFKLLSLGAVVAAGLVFAVAEGRGDIAGGRKEVQSKAAAEQGFERIGPEERVRVQCWQDGREIIDQPNLYGMALKPLFEQSSVSFRAREAGSPEVHIISIDETTCLIRSQS